MNKNQATVFSINISKEKGTSKTPIKCAELKEDFGIVGDAHAGFMHREVSLLPIEIIESYKLKSGDFAENITTKNIDLSKLNIGDKIKISGSLLEVTQIGKTCHNQCEVKKKLGECIMPKKGVFTKVLKGGLIRIGDRVII
ncbi:MAG: MOSC domain-containing protein [Candidatus Omnitrophota bacterium]